MYSFTEEHNYILAECKHDNDLCSHIQQSFFPKNLTKKGLFTTHYFKVWKSKLQRIDKMIEWMNQLKTLQQPTKIQTTNECKYCKYSGTNLTSQTSLKNKCEIEIWANLCRKPRLLQIPRYKRLHLELKTLQTAVQSKGAGANILQMRDSRSLHIQCRAIVLVPPRSEYHGGVTINLIKGREMEHTQYALTNAKWINLQTQ